MDIRQLKYFETLARTKNFTKASEELFISQPSLSSQIKTLEKELGFKLFERTTKVVKLTDSGKSLYNHTIKIIREYNNLLKEGDIIKAVGSGEINIGVIDSTKYWIPHVISKFKDIYPDVSINLKWMGTQEVEKALLNYDIHFAITSSKTYESKHFKISPLIQEELVLITSLNHPFNKYKVINFTELQNENVIQYPSGNKLQNILLDTYRSAGFEPKKCYEVDNQEAAYYLVKAGLAVSIVPETYFKFANLNGIHILRIKNPTITRKVYTVYDQHRHMAPSVDEFIQILNEYFEKTEFS